MLLDHPILIALVAGMLAYTVFFIAWRRFMRSLDERMKGTTRVPATIQQTYNYASFLEGFTSWFFFARFMIAGGALIVLYYMYVISGQ